MTLYMLRESEGETRSFHDDEQGDTAPGWEAICARVVEVLGAWLDEAEHDTTLSHDKFCEMSAVYRLFENGGGEISLPYTIHVPAAGGIGAQTIAIWNHDDSRQGRAVNLSARLDALGIVTMLVMPPSANVTVTVSERAFEKLLELAERNGS